MRRIALTILFLALVASAIAAPPECPRWLGLNANGVLEYCDATGATRRLANGDTAGMAPTPLIVLPTAVPAPTATPLASLSATYDPASLAANAARCDTLTVNGVVANRPVIPMPSTTPAPGCVMSVPPWATGANTIRICWRNAFSSATACDTTSSTWVFVQP